jgi:ABC-type nitrate/sulfonate/bicarbonate transport system substrate-binding protein
MGTTLPELVRSRGLALLSLSVLALGLGAVALQSGPLRPVRIGLPVEPLPALFMVAVQDGHFARQGLEIGVFEFPASEDAVRAYDRGRLDGLVVRSAAMVASDHPEARAFQLVATLGHSLGAGADEYVLVLSPDLARAIPDAKSRTLAAWRAVLASFAADPVRIQAAIARNTQRPVAEVRDVLFHHDLASQKVEARE